MELGWAEIKTNVFVVAVGSAILLTGCESESDSRLDETGEATSSSVQADVPVGFDPCEDIPEQVVDAHNLTMPYPENSDASGGMKWRGCIWVQSGGGYGATIQATNITVEVVEVKNFADIRSFSIDGRNAVSSRQIEERLEESCTVNVEMSGGSLEVSITNPPSSSTSDQDTCELARELAEDIVPSLPALG